jgi:small-conductance mechanosensitive channel
MYGLNPAMEISFSEVLHLIGENQFLSWAVVIGISFVLAGLAKGALKFIESRLRRYAELTTTSWDDVALDLFDGVQFWILWVIAISVLSKSLKRSESIGKVFFVITVLALSLQLIIWGFKLIGNWKKSYLEHKINADPSASAAIGLMYTVIRAVFVAVVVLIALSNLGVDISALVAGLGVGGIAVALAAQNVLGDLLASLSIVLDKPFVVGDFIVAGADKGTVEQIGIKTTRLRSLSGEQLVLSNKDLLESRIQNFKRMMERRAVQQIGVVYGTNAEKLEEIPNVIRAIVEKQKKLRFDRCHFASYGESSLNFEIVFYVLDSDYNVFMDIQQSVLLDIFKEFSARKIDFAFPTRTLIIERSAPDLKY